MTRKFKTTSDTFLKPKGNTKQSTYIQPEKLIPVKSHTYLEVADRILEKDNHFEVTMTFMIYKGHIEEEKPSKKFHSNTKEGNIARIIEKCKDYGCLKTQASYILATVQHETAHTFKPVREAFWISEVWRNKNLRYYPYYGRGFVQLTWKSNYARWQLITGFPLVENPDLVMEPDLAARILVEGMMKGHFGTALPVFVNSRKTDFRNARRSVNIMDKADLFANTAKQWLNGTTLADYDR